MDKIYRVKIILHILCILFNWFFCSSISMVYSTKGKSHTPWFLQSCGPGRILVYGACLTMPTFTFVFTFRPSAEEIG